MSQSITGGPYRPSHAVSRSLARPDVYVREGTGAWGEDEWSPELLRFDAIVDGHALRADLSGCDYFRVSRP
ncbi:MAG: hypothetical protein ACRDGE_05080 [Candidatus Limnocylindria bacterium]